MQGSLNRFRDRLGLPPSHRRPDGIPNLIDQAFEVLLEERVPVWSIGLGNPGPDMVQRCHERGMKVVAMVSTVEDARIVAGAGVDAVVAQGSEAGGHRSTWVKPASRYALTIGTMALVPQVVEAVTVPVIAGRHRRWARPRGRPRPRGGGHPARNPVRGDARNPWRRSSGRSRSSSGRADDTTVTDAFSGLWLRTLRNTYTARVRGARARRSCRRCSRRGPLRTSSRRPGGAERAEYFPMLAGQGVGLVRDLPGAGEVVETIVREARVVLAGLPRRARTA